MHTRIGFVLVAAATLCVTPAWPALAQSSPGQDGSARQPAQTSRDQRNFGQWQNASLQDRIFVRLAERAWAGKDFKVAADNGTVTISGTVPSDNARQRVLRIVRTTPGVDDVKDQLQVKPSSAKAPAQTVPDDQLSKQVAQRIADAIPGSKAGQDWWGSGSRVEGPSNTWNFTVDADQGDITLDGDVPRSALVRKAVQAALDAQGVRSVRSDLDIEHADRAAYPYGWGYAYHPYYGPGYSREYGTSIGREPASMTAEQPSMANMKGVHTMSGQVTSVDHDSGKLSLKTHEGTLDLHFPPSALKDVKRGDQLNVELGFRAPSGSQQSGS
jgi:osmotically-inducible protein OsmY